MNKNYKCNNFKFTTKFNCYSTSVDIKFALFLPEDIIVTIVINSLNMRLLFNHYCMRKFKTYEHQKNLYINSWINYISHSG